MVSEKTNFGLFLAPVDQHSIFLKTEYRNMYIGWVYLNN